VWLVRNVHVLVGSSLDILDRVVILSESRFRFRVFHIIQNTIMAPAVPTLSENPTVVQGVLREVNEHIREAAQLDTSVFICECSDVDCFGTLELSLAQYDCIRSVPTWFILKSGHADPALDQLVNENDRFIVVERSVEKAA
jgi:hypothetical protein